MSAESFTRILVGLGRAAARLHDDQEEQMVVANYVGPGRYRHYKGGEYEVLGVGLEEATLASVVIYTPTDGRLVSGGQPEARFWTRPLDDFNERVYAGPEGDRHRVPRFEKIP